MPFTLTNILTFGCFALAVIFFVRSRNPLSDDAHKKNTQLRSVAMLLVVAGIAVNLNNLTIFHQGKRATSAFASAQAASNVIPLDKLNAGKLSATKVRALVKRAMRRQAAHQGSRFNEWLSVMLAARHQHLVTNRQWKTFIHHFNIKHKLLVRRRVRVGDPWPAEMYVPQLVSNNTLSADRPFPRIQFTHLRVTSPPNGSRQTHINRRVAIPASIKQQKFTHGVCPIDHPPRLKPGRYILHATVRVFWTDPANANSTTASELTTTITDQASFRIFTRHRRLLLPVHNPHLAHTLASHSTAHVEATTDAKGETEYDLVLKLAPTTVPMPFDTIVHYQNQQWPLGHITIHWPNDHDAVTRYFRLPGALISSTGKRRVNRVTVSLVPHPTALYGCLSGYHYLAETVVLKNVSLTPKQPAQTDHAK